MGPEILRIVTFAVNDRTVLTVGRWLSSATPETLKWSSEAAVPSWRLRRLTYDPHSSDPHSAPAKCPHTSVTRRTCQVAFGRMVVTWTVDNVW